MRDDATAPAELAEIAASADPLPKRADALLRALHRLVPFDAAWLALADPLRNSYSSLASAELDDATVEYLSGPMMARDIDATGTNRARPPLSPSDLPYAAAELPTWADCLIPAGYHEALAVGLFGPGGRHVGFLALLSGTEEPPSPAVRCRLGRFASVIAQGIDPMRSLLTAARLVPGATAGVVLRGDGDTQPLPGLEGHPLLAAGCPVPAAARTQLRSGQVYASFLWPVGGRHAPDGHIRVTALSRTEDVPAVLTGMVLLSPAPDAHGLTPRELEVLGLLVDGCSNQEIARELVVAQRTVAAHLEHILVKLRAPTRTLAAVRAEQEGLYVPRHPRGAEPQVRGASS
jgi:DNA-binding CsgD family transcriptional regulator